MVTRLISCAARVEYLACEKEILEMRKTGMSIAAIHRSLLDTGRITMKYRTLVTYVSLDANIHSASVEEQPKKTDSKAAQNAIALRSDNRPDAKPFGQKKDPKKPYNTNI